MTIPINIWRLARALYKTNNRFGIPKKNRIRLRLVHSILIRMNQLREGGVPYHAACQQAAAEEPNLGFARAAVCRSAISVYNSYVKADLKRRGKSGMGLKSPEKPPKQEINFGCAPNGQYQFL